VIEGIDDLGGSVPLNIVDEIIPVRIVRINAKKLYEIF
jgi:hypothetical protein